MLQICNQNRVTSSPKSACQSVNSNDLENFVKCWKGGFANFCEPNSSMLGAKLVNDPKIKVVPHIKNYNFALVTTSMQGL